MVTCRDIFLGREPNRFNSIIDTQLNKQVFGKRSSNIQLPVLPIRKKIIRRERVRCTIGPLYKIFTETFCIIVKILQFHIFHRCNLSNTSVPSFLSVTYLGNKCYFSIKNSSQFSSGSLLNSYKSRNYAMLVVVPLVQLNHFLKKEKKNQSIWR